MITAMFRCVKCSEIFYSEKKYNKHFCFGKFDMIAKTDCRFFKHLFKRQDIFKGISGHDEIKIVS